MLTVYNAMVLVTTEPRGQSVTVAAHLVTVDTAVV